MALGDGGLDAQVEQRMDAYRGDPQKLQQRYGQNKELLDLLALQKLTAEKKQVAADMQLKAQQNPNTIAQQREQEALELVKQEMGGTLGELAGRTKGTLDQKQAMQRKNMGKLAQNASRPQPGPGAGLAGLMGGGARPPARPPVNPQAAGLANARMVQAARGGPIKMAQGGIVSFANGEKVTLSEDQKKKAREIYGPLYDNIIGSLLEMDADNPAAAPILNQLGPAVQSSKIGRFFRGLVEQGPPGTQQTESGLRNQLESDVRQKYGTYTGLDGVFRNQSDEQSAYAKQVISSINDLSVGELQALLDAPFESGMDPSVISSLPNVFPDPVTDPAVVGGASVEETSTEIDGGDTLASSITYPSTYVNPQDILSKVDTSYTVENAQMPPTTELDKAETDLSAAALKTADASLLDVDAPKVAELKPVDAPFSPRDQERYNAMMNIYADDARIDPEGAGKAARTDSDAHLRRAENDADFRRMSAEEKELQARLFSPAQLASEARIATFGGAARGRGGMSAAYTDVMGKQRKDLTDALGRLRGIDKDRISTDLSTAQTSSARGSEAAGRAANRRAGGLGAIAADFAAKEKRALQAQELETKGNIAVYEHQSALAQKTFGAAEASIQRNFDALEQIVTGQRTRFNAQVDLNIAAADENNEARKAAMEKLVDIAEKKAEYAFKAGELASKDVTELEKIKRDKEVKVTEFVTAFMKEDPRYRALAKKMMEMAGAENSPAFKELEAQAKVLYEAYMGAMIAFAPDLFGEQEYLKDYIARVKAGTPYSSGSPLPSGTPVTALDSPTTLGIGSLDAASQIR